MFGTTVPKPAPLPTGGGFQGRSGLFLALAIEDGFRRIRQGRVAVGNRRLGLQVL